MDNNLLAKFLFGTFGTYATYFAYVHAQERKRETMSYQWFKKCHTRENLIHDAEATRLEAQGYLGHLLLTAVDPILTDDERASALEAALLRATEVRSMIQRDQEMIREAELEIHRLDREQNLNDHNATLRIREIQNRRLAVEDPKAYRTLIDEHKSKAAAVLDTLYTKRDPCGACGAKDGEPRRGYPMPDGTIRVVCLDGSACLTRQMSRRTEP